MRERYIARGILAAFTLSLLVWAGPAHGSGSYSTPGLMLAGHVSGTDGTGHPQTGSLPEAGGADGTSLPEGADAPDEAETLPAPSAGLSLLREPHTAYISDTGDALPMFRPSDPMARAQAAQLFYGLLDGEPPQPRAYADIPRGAWYEQAAGVLGALGVMRAEEATFLPDEPMTRAEFTRCLACFFPLRGDAEPFPDVPEEHPAAQAIRSARAWGWVQGGEGGGFRPDDPITRIEAVVMVNRALGREPDRTYIGRTHPAYFVDAGPENWYYADLAEASVTHTFGRVDGAEQWDAHTPADEPPTGFACVSGSLYYYDRQRGDVLRGTQAGMLRFTAQGQLSAGSARLDRLARETVAAQPGLSPEGLSAVLEAAPPEWSLTLVNRDNPLPQGFAPPELTKLDCGYSIDSRVAPALNAMLAGARAAGYNPVVCSAYRTYGKQSELFERRVRERTARGTSRADAEASVAFWVARPGTSEHQLGFAADVIDGAYQVLNHSQEKRPVQKWLMAHCAEYGFILRYPDGKSGLTGVGYEPWHYRYVGVEAAREIMSRGICLEEYLSE